MVPLTEEFLESTTSPYYAGVVDYGARDEHCWNGDHDQPNAVSRLRYVQMYTPLMRGHPSRYSRGDEDGRSE